MEFDYIDLKRREQNLTVTKLCDLAGINRTTYYNLKRKNSDIKLSTVRKIFKALDLNAAEQKRVIS